MNGQMDGRTSTPTGELTNLVNLAMEKAVWPWRGMEGGMILSVTRNTLMSARL